MSCHHRTVSVLSVMFGLTALVFGQAPVSAPTGASASARLSSLPEPPVPGDPLELVTGETQVVQNPEQRAQILNLLARARYLSNVRGHAYDLKTTFTSVGQSPFDGTWQMEDVSPAANACRWTAQGSNGRLENI